MTGSTVGTSAVGTKTVVGKVATVLHAFTADDHRVTLAELGRRTGLPKATLHRVVHDLVGVGLLDKSAAGYRLSAQMFELGLRAPAERDLLEAATPFLEDLYERTHETVHLGVPRDTDVVYLTKICGHRQATAPSRIGGRMPLYCTAIGKVLLADAPPGLVQLVVSGGLVRRTRRTITDPGLLGRQLAQVRAAGVAYEYEESTPGITCVAAPIRDAAGRAAAAVSLMGPVTRFRPKAQAAAVRAAAEGVSAALA
ncbi:MAG: IclR family transcriptional regulator, partial [Streptomycetaceae bacterium]|nr:IclR family transcriptional regulator [Streptomycetaceae bacterium]